MIYSKELKNTGLQGERLTAEIVNQLRLVQRESAAKITELEAENKSLRAVNEAQQNALNAKITALEARIAALEG